MLLWQTEIAKCVRAGEAYSSLLKTLAPILRREFPLESDFNRNKPLIEIAILGGLSGHDLEIYSTEYPKKRAGVDDLPELVALKKRKKLIANKIHYYKEEIKEAMFPTKGARDFEKRAIILRQLQKRSNSENVEIDEDESITSGEVRTAKRLRKVAVQAKIDEFDSQGIDFLKLKYK